MAEIIQFKPRQGRVTTHVRTAPAELPPAPVDMRGAMTFQHNARGGYTNADHALSVLVEMQTYLNSLEGFNQESSRANIELRKQALAGYTYERLVEIARRSDQLMWKQRPAYYQALLNSIIDAGATDL